MMKRKSIVFALLFTLIFAIPKVKAAYNYSPLLEVVASAEALIINQVVDSSNIVDQNNQRVNVSFGSLVDVATYNGDIYIVDNSNNKVYVLDENFHYKASFPDPSDTTLKSPNGIYVTKDYIYVADTNNLRVAIFDHNYKLVSEIKNPDDPTFKKDPSDKEGYDFKPLKVTVNRSGRVYVVAEQIFEGILDFNPDGSFSRYVGANTVTVSAWEAFWLLFTSEAQRKAQGYRLATAFVNLCIDDDGYLYTVSSSSEGAKVIKKLNYKGHDVLIRNGYFSQIGDVVLPEGNKDVPTGSSEFIDIDVNEYGTYSVLDKTRGRIFTYDFEGNLLYIGGQLGNVGGSVNSQRSLFLKPEALTYYKDKILVVDSLNKNLVVLEYTEFAKLVNEATYQYYLGNYEEAKKFWEEVLIHNTNYYLAYAGIGKAQYREGNYEEAMQNLKIGYDDYYYSRAYQKHRYAKLVAISPYIIGGGIALVLYLFYRSLRNSLKLEREEENNE